MELSKVLLGLMKNAEELWGQNNGTQKKKRVIEQLKHLQWMGGTKEATQSRRCHQ